MDEPKTGFTPKTRRGFLGMLSGAGLATILSSCGQSQSGIWAQFTPENESAVHREGREVLQAMHLVQYQMPGKDYLFPVKLSEIIRTLKTPGQIAKVFDRHLPDSADAPIGYYAVNQEMKVITTRNWQDVQRELINVRAKGSRVTDHPPEGKEKAAMCEYHLSERSIIPPPADGTNNMGERSYPKGFSEGWVTVALPPELAKLKGRELKDPARVAQACGRSEDDQVLGEYKLIQKNYDGDGPVTFSITRENLGWTAEFLEAVAENGRDKRAGFVDTGAGRSL